MIISINRKAKFNFLLKESFEAGIILKGWEIKSIRKNSVNINNSYVTFKNNEAYLNNLNIKPLNNIIKCDSLRMKKLLLNKKEIFFLLGKISNRSISIVATSIYWKKFLIKLCISVVTGKKKIDKRYDLKNKEWKINKERILKNKSEINL